MAAKPLPDQALLLKLLRYEPETGKLYWRERTDKYGFATRRSYLSWNGKYPGTEAFTADDGLGYPNGCIMGVGYKAHRIIWKMVTGEEPDCIDHINGDRSDNRFCNLRSVEKAENNRNARTYKSNTSGQPGVHLRKDGSWVARITVQGRRQNIGSFKTKEDAVRARKAAERKFGFHPNHGRSAER